MKLIQFLRRFLLILVQIPTGSEWTALRMMEQFIHGILEKTLHQQTLDGEGKLHTKYLFNFFK